MVWSIQIVSLLVAANVASPRDVYLAHLITHPRAAESQRGFTQAQMAEMQAEHVRNLSVLAKANKNIFAGPLGENIALRGIVVMPVKSAFEAHQCFASDPFIKNDILMVKTMRWTMRESGLVDGSNLPFVIGQYGLGYAIRKNAFAPEPSADEKKAHEEVLAAADRDGVLGMYGPVQDAHYAEAYIFKISDAPRVKAIFEASTLFKSGRYAFEYHSQYAVKGMFGN